MTVLAHRSSHRDTVLDAMCLLCGAQPETAPHAGHGVPPPRHRGVHTGLVRPRQGACHAAKGPPWPGKHDGVGTAGATPAPTSGARGSAAGASGVRTGARGVPTRLPPLPARTCTHTHGPARLPVPVGRHPGLCLLVTAPSAHNTTPHHTTPPTESVACQPLPEVDRRQ